MTNIASTLVTFAGSTITAGVILAASAVPSFAQLSVSLTASDIAPSLFDTVLPMAQECVDPTTDLDRKIFLNNEMAAIVFDFSDENPAVAENVIVQRNVDKLLTACGEFVNDTRVAEQKSEDESRRQRVLLEAAEACYALDERDTIAARTNPLCHDIFLQTKYQ